MRHRALILGLSVLLTSTACSAELLNAILEEPASSTTNTNTNSVSTNTSTSSNPPSLTPPAPPANTQPAPATQPVSPPPSEFIGDGFDPSQEGGQDGTTTNNGFNSDFTDFMGQSDVYFGPSGGATSLASGLTGNDAAGTRVGGPNNVVGILVTHENGRGYMKVVNLQNKGYFPVERENGDDFNVAADTLGGKPFPSLFITSIPSLTQFTFEHRTSPNPPKCTHYTATYDGSSRFPAYKVKQTSGTGCTYF